MLDQIKIVLVGTTHSGNIGSAARAMKVMGLERLILAAPQTKIDGQALALASGASDVMNNAYICESIEQAIADSSLIIGCSARDRHFDWPMLEPKEMADKAMLHAANNKDSKIAILFGRENSGLTNRELQLCNYHVNIPANPNYSSLNLAMAVQTISYELRQSWLKIAKIPKKVIEKEHATSEQVEFFFEHLEHSLNMSGFIIKNHPGTIMDKLRRLYNRSQLEPQEINILRGMLTAYEREMTKDLKTQK